MARIKFLLGSLLIAGAVLFCTHPLLAAPWLVFTEVNYHSPLEEGNNDPLEFIELFNLEAPHVDLEGWKLEGEVKFRFPEGTRLNPRECLVIASDPEALGKRFPRVKRILGPYSGRLNNAGGRLILRNRAGAILAEMRYGRKSGWTAVPDGTAHTLVLADPYLDPTSPRNWNPSSEPGGSPGTVETEREEAPGDLLIREGDPWKFFRGKSPPPRNWTDLDLDDANWEVGPSGFGYGDGDDATVLNDMEGSYLSVYTRKVFTVEDIEKLSTLFLRVDFDDSFRVVLNGREIARVNLPAGFSLPHNLPAMNQREAGNKAVYQLGPASEFLKRGRNVLAAEAHNSSLSSSDLSLIVELENREIEDRGEKTRRVHPVINEVLYSSPDRAEGGWVEIYNPSENELALEGFFLSDDPGELKKYPIPKGAVIPSNGFLLLSRDELGSQFSLSGRLVTLAASKGLRAVDALLRPGKKEPAEARGTSHGRSPDGSADVIFFSQPTPGRSNRQSARAALVINEIQYHPLEGDSAGEYLEIFNRGEKLIDLESFQLRGGIRFDFPKKKIAPREFLIVAKEPQHLAKKYGLPMDSVLGPFGGVLSNGGDSIDLLDPAGIPLDRVAYADRSPWPEGADGWGPSLELVNPDADNSLAQAWRESHSSSEWKAYRYTKELRPSRNGSAAFLQFLLLDTGACLIDDIHLEDASGRTIVKETFDGETAGSWKAYGTHSRSGLYRQSSEIAYRLAAEGRGNPRFNFIAFPLPGELRWNQTYTLSFRARWISGCRLLLTRASGQVLAKTHSLGVPDLQGSPGRANTVETKEWPPLLGTPVQDPVAPRSTEAVAISVPVSSGEAIKAAWIHYRQEGGGWKQEPLRDDGSTPGDRPGDGIYAGQIPPLSGEVVEFYLSVTDAGERRGTFPRGAPDRTALYAIDLMPSRRFPTCTLLVSRREWQAFRSRQSQSNLPMDATLVYGTSRIIHNVGLRPRGSPWTRGNMNWRITLGAETIDGRHSLTFDAQQSSGANLRERLTYWLIDELDAPTPRQRYMYINFPGHQEENGLYEEVEKVDRDFLDRWFGNPSASEIAKPAEPSSDATVAPGLLFKVDDHWELTPPVLVERSGLSRLLPLLGGSRTQRIGGTRSYIEASLDYRSADPEEYRWNFPPRANGGCENFEPLIQLIQLMDPDETEDRQFCETVESQVNIDEWLRVLAARAITNDWDSIGRRRGKNAYFYRSTSDNRWYLLPWDADLAWSNSRYPFRSIFPEKFPAFRRILSQPKYRRRFFACLAYLIERRMEPAYLESILQEFKMHVGSSPGTYLDYAESALQVARGQLPRYSFRIDRIDRLPRSEGPDLLKISGSAPVLVYRLTLDGRSGDCQFPHDEYWVATFPIGPEGSTLILQALDYGGQHVHQAAVKVPPRPDAKPLPSLEEQ